MIFLKFHLFSIPFKIAQSWKCGCKVSAHKTCVTLTCQYNVWNCNSKMFNLSYVICSIDTVQKKILKGLGRVHRRQLFQTLYGYFLQARTQDLSVCLKTVLIILSPCEHSVPIRMMPVRETCPHRLDEIDPWFAATAANGNTLLFSTPPLRFTFFSVLEL